MSFEKTNDGKIKLIVPFGNAGNSELDVTANEEGILFDDDILSWEEIDELRLPSMIAMDKKISANPILEYRPNIELKPNELYYVENYRIGKNDLILRVSADNADTLYPGPLVEFDINQDKIWRSKPYIVGQGDNVRLRIRTPASGTCIFNIFLNDMLAIRLTTTVKEG